MSEEIIIDGVDISGCENKDLVLFDKEHYCKEIEYDDGSPVYTCEERPDCYFKQLKRLQKEKEELKKYYNGFIANCKYCDEWYMDKCNYIKKDNKYKQALEEIRDITKTLITETPEYNSCYYKDECGDNCTPKKQSKVQYCCYENVEKIETIINEVLNDRS
jgi:hypothetical protein